MHAPYNIPNKNLVFTNRSSLRTCHAKLHQFTLNVILVCYIAVQNIDYSQTTYQSNKGHGTTWFGEVVTSVLFVSTQGQQHLW